MAKGKSLVKRDTRLLDKIRMYYLDGPDSVKLSKSQEEKRIQIDKAWNLCINYHSRHQAVKVLKTEYDLSDAQAYRIINMAFSIFGNVFQNDKDAKRALLEEYNMQLFQRAVRDKDLEIQGRCLDRAARLSGLDREDKLGFDPDKIKQMSYNIIVTPEIQPLLKELLKNEGTIDLNNLDVEDIDFKEVENEES